MAINTTRYTLPMQSFNVKIMMFNLGIVLISLTHLEVECILDCLFAKSKIQKTTDTLNIMANSVLEFIWKIDEWSELYTTETYRQKLRIFGGLQSKESTFDNFIWAFVDQNFKEALCIANSVLFH